MVDSGSDSCTRQIRTCPWLVDAVGVESNVQGRGNYPGAAAADMGRSLPGIELSEHEVDSVDNRTVEQVIAFAFGRSSFLVRQDTGRRVSAQRMDPETEHAEPGRRTGPEMLPTGQFFVAQIRRSLSCQLVWS
jgi:hypothetical protein